MEKVKRFLPPVLGLVCALGLYVLTHGLLQAIVGGFVVFFIFRVAFTPRKRPEQIIVSEGLNKLAFDERVQVAEKNLQILQNEGFKVINTDVREKIKEIAALVSEIIKDIKNHPEDFNSARQFFNYYLEATLKIVRQYVDLSNQAYKSEALNNSLQKVEEELESIRKAFEKQLQILIDNDVLDLDVELKVLKTSLDLEGFSVKNKDEKPL